MKVPLAVRALPSVAEKVWWTPPRSRSLSLERALGENPALTPISLDWEERDLHGFRAGGGPLVVLVHGWGGQAAQMAPLAAPIADRGFTAVALDLPGHGGDPQTTSDAFQMAAAVKAVVGQFEAPTAVVAHSLGAIVAQVAFQDRLPDRTVLLAPLLDAEHAVSVFSERAQLLPWTARRLHARFERFVGDEWWPRMTRGSDIELGESEMLVVHDADDGEAPFDTAAAMADKHPSATFVGTSGLGHNRILIDPGVVDIVARFVTSPPSSDDSSRSLLSDARG